MKLTDEQVKQFHEEGWLFLPDLFTQEEVAVLNAEGENIYKQQREEVWREKSGAPRTAFAAHLYNEAFGILGRHPRMIEPIEQVFGEQVYMHQFKINAKAKFSGDVWQWHQDYGTWARDDGMPEPRAMNIAIFLDEVFPYNGALMLIPKSHTEGVLAAGHDKATTSYPLWTLDEPTVQRLYDQGGLVVPTGKAGGMLMFHGNLVHGSAGNITPLPRKIVYLTLNACSNHITKPTRPEWIAHQDFSPIVPYADNALTEYARRYRQAAEQVVAKGRRSPAALPTNPCSSHVLCWQAVRRSGQRLPVLFVFAARVPIHDVLNWPFLGAYLGGSLLTLLLSVLVGIAIFRHPIETLTLQGLTAVFANTAYMGVPLLLAAIGPRGVLQAIISTLATATLLIGGTIAILEAKRAPGPSHWKSIWDVARTLGTNPLLIAPFLGIAFSYFTLPIPKPIANFLDLMAAAAGTGALFALRLSLVGRKLLGDIREVVWLVVLKLIVHPAIQPLRPTGFERHRDLDDPLG